MAKVTLDTTILEVLKMDKTSAAIFMKKGMHCIGCPASSGESIAEAASVHGISAQELVDELNAYLAEK